MKKRTVSNTTPKQAAQSGVEFLGDPNKWVVLHKAWNTREGWMRSTKALEIPGVGCMVQVSMLDEDRIAESLCFVPDVGIADDSNSGRKLVRNQYSTLINFSSSGSSSTGWVGTAGDALDAKLEAMRKQEKENNPLNLPGAAPGDPYKLIRELTDFFKESWKVCPTNKQWQQLIALLKANLS